MRLQIKTKGFELTPSLQQFVEEKMSGLEKFLERWDKEGAVILDVEISKTTQHHNKGNVYYAEGNLQIPNAPLLRIEETNEEMRAAIDKLKDRLKNELLRFKEKISEH
jgi:ribosomal subunit interface protein